MRYIIEKTTKSLIRSVIRVMPQRIRNYSFGEIARILDIKSIEVSGKQGLYKGAPHDLVITEYAEHKEWSQGIISLILSALCKNDTGTYLDIGANIGLTLIPVAKNTESNCYGFEPEPLNYSFLSENILANECQDRVVVFNYALFDKDTELGFELSNSNLGDHRIHSPNSLISGQRDESNREVIKVPARKLDSLTPELKIEKPVVVKMDVQGAEVQVLKGGAKFFKEVDLMISEFWPYGLLRMGDDPTEFCDLVVHFKFGAIKDGKQASFPKLIPMVELQRQLKILAKSTSYYSYWDVMLSNTEFPAEV